VEVVRLIKVHLKATRIVKCSSNAFPIPNGLEQGDALSPVFLKLALEYAIRKVQENQFMACADCMNLLGLNTIVIRKKTQKLY